MKRSGQAGLLLYSPLVSLGLFLVLALTAANYLSISSQHATLLATNQAKQKENDLVRVGSRTFRKYFKVSKNIIQIELSEKIHLLTKTEQRNKELQRYEGDLLKCLEERGALEAAAEETDNSTLTRPQLVAALTNLTRQLTQLREELWLANSAKTQLGRTIVQLREQVYKHSSNCCKILQN